jgi:hypothetical protein
MDWILVLVKRIAQVWLHIYCRHLVLSLVMMIAAYSYSAFASQSQSHMLNLKHLLASCWELHRKMMRLHRSMIESSSCVIALAPLASAQRCRQTSMCSVFEAQHLWLHESKNKCAGDRCTILRVVARSQKLYRLHSFVLKSARPTQTWTKQAEGACVMASRRPYLSSFSPSSAD